MLYIWSACVMRRRFFIIMMKSLMYLTNTCVYPNMERRDHRMIEQWIGNRIGNLQQPMDEHARSAWGKAASYAGIMCNVLLFVFKLAAGLLSGSVAIAADAVNNLSDASSSLISLLGFKLAEKPADAEHPYGHGRFEYLSGLMVAVMILVIGIELLKGSIEKIITPVRVNAGAAVYIILLGSILAKLWMARFNRKIGRAISSKALLATADDSRNDVIATISVLLSTLIARMTGWTLDGYMGVMVAAFILVSGFGLVREAINPMLGAAPTKEDVEAIRRRLESYPGVLGTHDLMIHDYGPGRQYASVHLEMDAREDPMAAHDLIDNIEREFLREMGLHMVIHYDPVAADDPRIAVMKAVVAGIVTRIHPKMTVHDLRIVAGNTHTNVVFDCVVPYDLDMGAAQIKEIICREVARDYPGYYCVITLERGYE